MIPIVGSFSILFDVLFFPFAMSVYFNIIYWSYARLEFTIYISSINALVLSIQLL